MSRKLSLFRFCVSNTGQTHAASFPSADPYLNSSSVRPFGFLLSQNSQEKMCKSSIYQNALRTSRDYYHTANFPALQTSQHCNKLNYPQIVYTTLSKYSQHLTLFLNELISVLSLSFISHHNTLCFFLYFLPGIGLAWRNIISALASPNPCAYGMVWQVPPLLE